jgi:endoglucanase
MALYVNADGHSRQAASMLRVTGKKEQAQKIDEQIANRPSAICLTTVSPEAYMQARAITEEASGQGKVPVLVAYNLPERDCGLYSSGGATNIKTYLQWLGSSRPASRTGRRSSSSSRTQSPTAWRRAAAASPPRSATAC